MRLSQLILSIIFAVLLLNNCFALTINDSIVLNYYVRIHITGQPEINQQVIYSVKDNQGNFIVNNKPLKGEWAVVTWQSYYKNIHDHSGVFTGNSYTIIINNIYTMVTDKYNKTHFIKTTIPIHIDESPKDLTSSDSFKYDPGAYLDEVTLYGSLGIKVSTLPVSKVSAWLGYEQSGAWGQIISSKDGIDRDKGGSIVKAYSYILPGRDGISTIFLDNQIDLNLSIPYVLDFVSIKNMPKQPSEYTLGYQFGTKTSS